MNRTIRNLIVAAPLATIALTLVPVGAATAGPNDPNFPIVIKPKGGDPKPDFPIAIPEPKPKGPQDKAPLPKPKPKDKAPKPAAKPQPKAPKAVAPKAAVATTVVADTAAIVVSAKGSADSIDRSDTLFVSEPLETQLVVEDTDGSLDLTWLLVGGGIVTASGIAFAARKRQQNA